MFPWQPRFRTLRAHAVRVGLAVILLLSPAAMADDSARIEAAVSDARALLALPDASAGERALERLNAARAAARESLEFWEMYLRAWLAAGRSAEAFFAHGAEPADGVGADPCVVVLMRARREKDEKARRTLLERAARRPPQAQTLRLHLARQLIAAEAFYDAEELLDVVLEDAPGLEEAVTLKCDLLLEDGMASRVVALAEQGLERETTPALLVLKARGLRVMSQNSQSEREAEAQARGALEAAAKAVEMDPRPAYVLLYVDLLEAQGETDKARALLEQRFKQGKSAELGLRLAHQALQAGDYPRAATGLEPAAADHLAAARALCVVHTRLGRASEARSALALTLRHDPDAKLFAAATELALGAWSAARDLLGAPTTSEGRELLARALAWGGDVAAARALADPLAREGSREAEEFVLALLEASAFERLGARAEGVRRKLIEARAAAARMRPARPSPGSAGFKAQARTEGFALRLPTYVRSVSGSTFATRMQRLTYQMHLESVSEGEFRFSQRYTLECTSDCDVEPERTFAFDGLEALKDSDEEESGRFVDFAPAQAAFARGCAALLDADLAAAATAMDEALVVEPHFGRAALIGAAVRILSGSGDATEHAILVRDRMRLWPDDFSGRRLGVLLRILAGDGTVEAEIAALCEREAGYSERRISHL